MELAEFVKTTLVDIVKGLKGANSDLAGTDKFRLLSNEQISFDIAVTVSEESKSSAGGGIHVYAVKIGGEKGNLTTNESISRIKFNVTPGYHIS